MQKSDTTFILAAAAPPPLVPPFIESMVCVSFKVPAALISDIKTIASNHYQYAEVFVNGKTGSRPLPLINSIPYVKDYLDHEHPQPGNPDAILIAGDGKSLGRAIGVVAL